MIEVLSNKDYRDFQWYSKGFHISERIVRANEFLINQYEFGQITIEGIKSMIDDKYLSDAYFEDYNYNSYELKDIHDRLYILVEYLEKNDE